ncbi:MAG TPA: Npt1/Npt2 family nucleotide transporter [Thermodesulfobacteriota bacterium]|nr:Npt1/Npt2 family nucleotide transporter [Thermodesulfobacteriota bacterium]
MLKRIVEVKKNEVRGLFWSFTYFFCLLCAYYILRPVRDEMGIQGGVENLQWVFTGTFVAMLALVPIFGAAVTRFPRQRLVPLVYYFFIINLLVFFLLFRSGIAREWIARAFFIWVSVFNLFVVSVFWSFMADLFTNEQARRLFGFIAAGGSAGAVAGPMLTVGLSSLLGPVNLLPFSILLLFAAVVCIHRLSRWNSETAITENGEMLQKPELSNENNTRIGGGVLAGAIRVLKSSYLLGICLFIVLYTWLSTFLYFEQAHIVENTFSDSGKRTTLFASMDLAVNVLTIFAQVFITGRFMKHMGLTIALMIIPALLAIGFAALGLFPVLSVLVVFQVIRRAGNYAITRPAREVLFTVVPREDKYKSKNFIDTVVYRGGDAVSGWAFAGLSGLGLGLSVIAFIAVPIAAVWMIIGYILGRKQEAMRNEVQHPEQTYSRTYEQSQ